MIILAKYYQKHQRQDVAINKFGYQLVAQRKIYYQPDIVS